MEGFEHAKRLDEIQIDLLKKDVGDDYLIDRILRILKNSDISYERKEKALHVVNEMLFDKIVNDSNIYF